MAPKETGGEEVPHNTAGWSGGMPFGVCCVRGATRQRRGGAEGALLKLVEWRPCAMTRRRRRRITEAGGIRPVE
ncbi:unnamed protein product, partial [Nesidiocoris tenuis]